MLFTSEDQTGGWQLGSQGDPLPGYSATLIKDLGDLQPSRGARGCLPGLRTTTMYRPKIPEVLAAVREASAVYDAAVRALDELPGPSSATLASIRIMTCNGAPS
jgi:hypothetical protein